MKPNPSRVASRHRKASFQIGDYISDAKQAVMGRLLQQVRRDLEGKIKKAFESAFPDWEMVDFDVGEDTEDLGLNEPNRYLIISAEAKPKRSHPEYEYVGSERETEKKIELWADKIGQHTAQVGASDDLGPDFRYYLYFGRFRW